MLKNAFCFFYILGIGLNAWSQNLSDQATISLLTGSPGTELYSTFGHSAIRVKDPANNLDIVFNYGTFDFNTTNFYLKFVRGKLLYKLSVGEFSNFEFGFKYENRSVTEQVLNLTNEQKNRLYRELIVNYKPENRYYKYDFFFDNCATRIRDIMPAVFKEDFVYNYPDSWKSSQMTFRNLIDLYLKHHHWSDFGIDLALGLPTDGIATPADYMFLPDYLMVGIGTATILRAGEEVPFVLSEREIIPKKSQAPQVFLVTPVLLTSVILLLTAWLSYIHLKRQKSGHWFNMIFFTLIGLIGWAVFLLDFATDHIATKQNLNMLWAVPFHFPVLLLWKKFPASFRKGYVVTFMIINAIILIAWYWFPQNYHFAFMPLILAMILRYFVMIKSESKWIQ